MITGLIHDYGAVRWQYWVTGLTIHSTTELLIIGFASGWNPTIVVPAYVLDVVTDIPIWYGGAYVFGFRIPARARPHKCRAAAELRRADLDEG